jgi:hypothetical protein
MAICRLPDDLEGVVDLVVEAYDGGGDNGLLFGGHQLLAGIVQFTVHALYFLVLAAQATDEDLLGKDAGQQRGNHLHALCLLRGKGVRQVVPEVDHAHEVFAQQQRTESKLRSSPAWRPCISFSIQCPLFGHPSREAAAHLELDDAEGGPRACRGWPPAQSCLRSRAERWRRRGS